MPIIATHNTPTKGDLITRFCSLSAADKIFYLTVSCIYIVFLALAARNLDINALWYDESGQFFIAKGLNHYSDPNSPEGGIMDVIYNNARYNLDPGGYSIILHYWSMLSNHHIWLRLLSYTFFTGALILSILITRRATGNGKMAYLSGLFMFALWQGRQAYELRAYAMELCGIAFGIWMLLYLHDKITYRRLITCSLVLSAFITARYTMLVFGFIYTCFVVAGLAFTGDRPAKERLKQILSFAIWPAITAIAIYLLSMRIQNGDIRPLNYFHYMSSGKKVIIFWGLAILMLASWRWQTSRSRILICFFWVANLLFVTLASFQMLPWLLLGLKGGPFTWLLYITLYNSIITASKVKPQSKVAPWISMSLILFLICGGTKLYGAGPLKHNPSHYFDALSYIPENPTTPIYVGSGISPAIRYMAEYGTSYNQYFKPLIYPDDFIFIKGVQHNDDISGNIEGRFDYIEDLNNAPPGTIYIAVNTFDSIPQSFRYIVNLGGDENIYEKQ